MTWVMPCRCTTSSTAFLSRKSTFSKTYFGCFVHPGEILEAPGVGQAIEVDQLGHLGPVDDVMDEVGADEAGPASD